MLTVRVFERPEDLLDDLAALLSVPPPDPFDKDWVAVPSLGFRSWLQLQLAHRLGVDRFSDGIVANIDFPFPGTLRWTVLRAHCAHLGHENRLDPWQVDGLVWSLIHVMSDPSSDLDHRLTRAGLPPGVTLASRAAPIADLFDRYSVHRPEMLAAWSDGRDTGPDGQALDKRRLWQPQLFRAVRQHIEQRYGVVAIPSKRLVDALDLIRSGDLAVDHSPGGLLPRRLFVAGLSVLPNDVGPILDALGEHRDVALLLLAPSAEVIGLLAESVPVSSRATLGSASWAFPRSNLETQIGPEHPLLRSWAGRHLDSALLLGAGGVVPEVVTAPERPAGSLLEQVQADLRAGAVTENAWSGRPGDGSIRIHRSPGPSRQVEVLRDVILGLLRDVPDLTESDIAVVCPQLDLFAPVLEAVFGPSAQRGEQPHHGALPQLRYKVIDRNARMFNSVFDAMAMLLEMLPGRFDFHSVRGLLQTPAVRERFGLGEGDLGLLSSWVDQARIRWGLDGGHRERWGIGPDHKANSWSAGVDQLMMGVALGDDLRDTPQHSCDTASASVPVHALAVGGIAPVVLGESEIGSAGRLAAALRSLAHVHGLLQGPDYRTISDWCGDLRTSADLMLACGRSEAWQRAALDAVLDDLMAASASPEGEPSDVRVTFGDLRRLLSPALDGSRARADLGHGSLVVARPSLLGGVPFRVVCVLGLDQDALPAGTTYGDDLADLVAFVGDRDKRSEARAELLAALCSARDHFVITCTSTDVRTNEAVPESVLLDEFVDLLSTTMGQSVDDLREPGVGVVQTHPRHRFDHRNFIPADSAPPFSFDPAALEGARSLATSGCRPDEDGILLDSPLGTPQGLSRSIDLSDLAWFFAHPVKTFFRNRLNVTVPVLSEAGDSQLPTSLSALDVSAVGADLLAVGIELPSPHDVVVEPGSGRSAAEVEAVINECRARGQLPPQAVALPKLAEVSIEVEAMLAAAERQDVRRPATIDHPIDLVLPSGVRLVGSVNGCLDGPHPGPARISFHRPRPRNEVWLAIDLLALTATEPERSWRGVVVCRPRYKEVEPVVLVKEALGSSPEERRATAVTALEVLVAQYLDGQSYPLPLFERTSREIYTHGRPNSTWDSSNGRAPAEGEDGYHVTAFGAVSYFELRRLRPGGYSAVTEAERLWGALAESLVDVDGDGQADAP